MRSRESPWTDIGGEDTWGVVRPAHAEPVTSGIGLLVLGARSATSLPRTRSPPIRVSASTGRANDAFPGWFQQLERAMPGDAFTPGRDPFETWLQTRRSGVRPRRDDRSARRSPASRPPPPRSTTDADRPLPCARGNRRRRARAGRGRARCNRTRGRPDRGARRRGAIGSTATRRPAAPALPETDGLPAAGRARRAARVCGNGWWDERGGVGRAALAARSRARTRS